MHDILVPKQQEHGPRLLATRYSRLVHSPSFCAVGDGAVSDRELFLHFVDFDCMGERQDAEVIALHNGDWEGGSEIMSFSVTHMTHTAKDPGTSDEPLPRLG